MKVMNYEATKWRREAIDEVVLDEETLAKRRRRKRIIVILAAVAALLLVGLFMFGSGGEEAKGPAKGAEGGSLPAVTVIVPGRQDIPAIISATGSLAARRDMRCYFPRLEFCTDNGAMIAFAGCLRLLAGEKEGLGFRAKPQWHLSELTSREK